MAFRSQVQFNAHIEQRGLLALAWPPPGKGRQMGFSDKEDTWKALAGRKGIYLYGMAVCCELHPTLGTEPQNILTDGMYFVMFPVGAVRLNTWKRQFSTSAT
jgi:hypothetical protein